MIESINAKNNIIPASSIKQTNTVSQTSFADALNASLRQTNDPMNDIFQRAADTYNLPVALLKAVGKIESNFDTNAVSSCGASGVMQLMPKTAESLGVTDVFDAEQNIMGGAKYLAKMMDKFDGDIKLALAAYNAGANNVYKYDGIPPFKETQAYVTKVLEQFYSADLSTAGVAYTNYTASLPDKTYTLSDYNRFLEKCKAESMEMMFAGFIDGLKKDTKSNEALTTWRF